MELPSDGLNGDCIVHYSGDHSNCEMKVKLLNGMREGVGTIMKDGSPFIQIEYHSGAANGSVYRMGDCGKVELRGHLINGMERGVFREYDQDDKVVWQGFYWNGQRYSEVKKSDTLDGYYDERRVATGSLLSTAQYDSDLKDKNGRCYEYDNNRIKNECVYENGIRKRIIREFVNGKMVVYDSNGKKAYEGKWFGDMKSGFSCHEPMEGMDGFFKEVDSSGQLIIVSQFDELNAYRNGKCFELENRVVKRVCLYEMDQLVRVIMEFIGFVMVQYDENGKIIYEGKYKGNMKKGYWREGIGSELDENERVKRVCVYHNGAMQWVKQDFIGGIMTEYNENGKRIYEGGFNVHSRIWFERNGYGREFEINGETIIYSGEWNNGRREGRGTEFHDGNALYNGEWKSGLRNGSGKEMDKNGRIVFEGVWNYGKGKGKEMDKNGRVVYEGEWSNGTRNGKGKEKTENGVTLFGNWKDGKKDGFFCEMDENRVIKQYCLYENDELKQVVQEWDLYDMILSNRIVSIVMNIFDDSSFCISDITTGHTIGVFQLNRKCFSFDWSKDSSQAVVVDLDNKGMIVYVNGKQIDTQYTKEVIDLNTTRKRWEGGVKDTKPYGYGVIYDEKGKKEYEGFMMDGMKTCYGIEYFSNIGGVKYEGYYNNNNRLGKGILYDRNGCIDYDGLWNHNEPYSSSFDGKTIDNHIESISIPNCSFNESESFILPSFIYSLKRIVIRDNCFGSVRFFELDGLSELESVKIGKYCFRISDRERADGSCRIENCSKLKSIEIGYWSFSDYHSFGISNLPSLQSRYIHDCCFRNAPSFSLTGLIG